MRKVVSAILLLACSSFVNAGTGLNCSEEDVLSNPDTLEICIDQSNDWLNGTYKQLQARHKGEKSKLEALKKDATWLDSDA